MRHHGDDHFFPGPTDIAWDLAGTIVEWELAPAVDRTADRGYQQCRPATRESRLERVDGRVCHVSSRVHARRDARRGGNAVSTYDLRGCRALSTVPHQLSLGPGATIATPSLDMKRPHRARHVSSRRPSAGLRDWFPGSALSRRSTRRSRFVCALEAGARGRDCRRRRVVGRRVLHAVRAAIRARPGRDHHLRRIERARTVAGPRCSRAASASSIDGMTPRARRSSRVLRRHAALHDVEKPLVAADLDHAIDTWQWMLRLDPGASLRGAAGRAFHDVERLESEAGLRVEQHAPDYAAFKDSHAARGARAHREVLQDAGVDRGWLRGRANRRRARTPRERDPESIC